MATAPHPPAERYTATARWLHAVVAALVLGVVIPAGLWIVYFEPADEAFKMRLYNWHESLGVVVWLLTLVRLLWRGAHPPPAWPEATPRWVQLASGVSHAGLYVLLLGLPISGFLATNAWGFPLRVFEWIPLPSPIGKNEAWAKILSWMHGCAALCLGLLLCAHVLGAIYHRLVARDALARRMI
jgi:cytochrome b561